MADTALDVTFRQFLDEQKKTNKFLHQQAVGEEMGDSLKASFKNEAASVSTSIIQERKNRKEQDKTQEVIVGAEKENTESVGKVETAIIDSEEKQIQAIEKLAKNLDALPAALQSTGEEATGEATKQFSQKQLASQEQMTNVMKQVAEENAAVKKAETERALLGQTEKQYDLMLEQRKVTEASKKEMDDIGKALGEDAKNNKQYQDAQRRYNKNQEKSQNLEKRRSLLQRFKDTAARPDKGTKGAIKELGGSALAGIGKTFKSIGKFAGKLKALFAIIVLPALLLLVNSPAWGMLKEGIKNLIDYLSADDNFLFGKDGIIKNLRDKFGGLNVAIAGVLGLLTLKFLGFSGLKAAFLGLKFVVTKALIPIAIAIKGVFIAVLGTLTTFFGIAAAPLIAIVAGIAAVGYMLFDTFKEVRKKFLEGASVGELIQTAVVNFIGAFGKILDFVKDLLADVLELFGFEDIAKTIRKFSFEKEIEDALNKVFDFFKDLLDFDFMGFIKKIPGAKEILEFIGIDTTEKPKLTPEEKASQAISDQEGKELVNPFIAKQRKIEEARALANLPFRQATARITASLNSQKRRLAAAQKDVDTEGKGGFKFLKESEEEKRADDLRLFNEKQRLEMIKEELAALEGQKAKAQAAISINAPSTINNEGDRQETTHISQPIAMINQGGTVGALSSGSGTMYSLEP